MREGGRLFLLSVFQEIQKCDDTADSRTDGAKEQDSLLNDIPHPRSPPSVFAKEGFCYSRRLSTTLSRSGGIDRQHIQGVSILCWHAFIIQHLIVFVKSMSKEIRHKINKKAKETTYRLFLAVGFIQCIGYPPCAVIF